MFMTLGGLWITNGVGGGLNLNSMTAFSFSSVVGIVAKFVNMQGWV